MEPALEIGEYIEVIPIKDNKNFRGCIIAYYAPHEGKKRLIHRAIAVEGDNVHLKDGSLVINNIIINEPYAIGKTNYSGFAGNKIESIVPKGMAGLKNSRFACMIYQTSSSYQADYMAGKRK